MEQTGNIESFHYSMRPGVFPQKYYHQATGIHIPGGHSQKKWVGGSVRPTSQKPLALSITKICDFSHPIYNETKIRYPIYDRCDWHSYPNIIYEKLLLYGPADNDEKVT